jgi:pimeloyl-ACP methyl ester carboxylesterase
MGGRTALRLALDHGTRVAAMVLLGATAGIDGADDRRARRDADERLARRIEAEGTATFLRAWLAQPLFAGLEIDPDDRRAREANPPDGLAASLRLCGTGTMDPPWWPELGAIACPTLVVWGEHDPKFAGLGRRLAAAIGAHATTAEVPGAGHAVHLQQPGAVADLLVRFVEQLRGARPGRP